MTTAKSAVLVEPSKSRAGRPRPVTSVLIIPKSGLYISRQILPIATGGIRIGKSMPVRTRPRPLTNSLTAKARANPKIISMLVEAITKISVFVRALPKIQSFESFSTLSQNAGSRTISAFSKLIFDVLI